MTRIPVSSSSAIAVKRPSEDKRPHVRRDSAGRRMEKTSAPAGTANIRTQWLSPPISDVETATIRQSADSSKKASELLYIGATVAMRISSRHAATSRTQSLISSVRYAKRNPSCENANLKLIGIENR